MTLKGEHYDFNHIGYLRYFDNCEENRLFINIKTDHGDYERWKNNDYIRQVFNKLLWQKIVLDTGFRGKPVKILLNQGFEIYENKLEFNPSAYRYAGYSKYKSRVESRIQRYLKRFPNDVVPEFVRNSILVIVNKDVRMIIENVNEYNLQPCRIQLYINSHSNYNNWEGLVVDRKWAHSSILNNIDDKRKLPEPNPNQKLPELTIPGVKINKKWA